MTAGCKKSICHVTGGCKGNIYVMSCYPIRCSKWHKYTSLAHLSTISNNQQMDMLQVHTFHWFLVVMPFPW